VVHPDRQDCRIEARKAVPGRIAVDASAARDGGHPRARLVTYRAKARDCPWALDRDFLSAMAEPERLVLPERRDVQAQRPRDAWQRAVCRTVLRVVPVQEVAPLHLLLALLPTQADESELLPGQSLRVQQASRPAATLRVQEPAPWVLLEPRLRALPVQLALPPAQWEPRVGSVSLRLA
jgi:hypothetical protein